MLKGLRGAWLRGTRDPLQAALGPLERAVMDTMWRGGRLSVRDVQAQLANPAAYTTVMTTLDRLFKKGLVQRKRDGRAFVYSAAIERHELETSMTTGLLNGMLSSGPGATRPFLSNLVDAVGDSDNALLDELEQLVRDKRERIKDKRQGVKPDDKKCQTRCGRGPLMRLLLSSLFLGVVWFAAVNAIASLIAWPFGAWLLGRFRMQPPRRHGATVLLMARLLPSVASLVFVLAVFLPAHLRFEPAETDESFGLVLGGLAAVGLSLALRGAWRAGQWALAGHRFARLTRRAGNRRRGRREMSVPWRSAVCPACRWPASGARVF